MLAVDVSVSVENLMEDAKTQEIPSSCQLRRLCHQGFKLFICLKWISDQKKNQQKQKRATDPDPSFDSEDHLPRDDILHRVDSPSASESILSELSEDNDVLIHNMNGLQKWLTKGKKRLAQFFASWSSIYSEGRQRGPYKKKGTVQSLRTEQHNRKKERDW